MLSRVWPCTVSFLSTPSARRATHHRRMSSWGGNLFLSTPSARRATSIQRPSATHHLQISIHALREEGDKRVDYLYSACQKFLSTPSARRATCRGFSDRAGCRYFYPRPPRGGRHAEHVKLAESLDISIHALREEGDYENLCAACEKRDFYPRPPRGGRPYRSRTACRRAAISIHALREEGDKDVRYITHYIKKFLSTPSARRATQEARSIPGETAEFLSTPSARRATSHHQEPEGGV